MRTFDCCLCVLIVYVHVENHLFFHTQRFSCKFLLRTRVMPRACLRAIEYCVHEFHSFGNKFTVKIEREQSEPRHERILGRSIS